MKKPNVRHLVLASTLATCCLGQAALATQIAVDFGTPDPSNFLRLNMGSNGWTNPNWSQYYDDLGVQYRRMDHWNNAWDPIQRRTDGGLLYNYWPLDHVIYDATGGFHFKPYPTVDYSPACFTTDLLQNPMRFNRGDFHGQLTPAGTIIFWGKAVAGWGAPLESGMYEVDRKGRVVWKADYGQDFMVTPSNRLIINQKDGTYLVLNAARQQIAKGQGRPLQEVEGKSLLVRQGTKISLVGLNGTVAKQWPEDMPGQVAWIKDGLLEVTSSELLLHADAGTKSLFKLPIKIDPNGAYLSVNDKGRAFLTYGAYPGKWVYGAAALDENHNVLWSRDDFQTDAVRGSIVTSGGDFILPTVGAMGVTCFDGAGNIKWQASDAGALDNQLLAMPGMETLMLQAYNNTITEYDVRTGKITWQYGNVGDESTWVTTPPKDLTGWEDSIFHVVKHYNKDLGMGWDRWELWNEPGTNGYFWRGDWQQYANLAKATMSGIERSDPSIHMDLYSGDWAPSLVKWLSDNKVRFDGLTYHGYDTAEPNKDVVGIKARQAAGFMAMLQALPGKTPTLGDSEWNLHPGQGEDLSSRYETGYYRAPFQSELIKTKSDNGVTFSSEFCMESDITWPAGWVYATTHDVGGRKAPAGGMNKVFTPAYSAAKLWSMLPQQKVSLTNDFQLQPVKGTSEHVDGVAAADPKRGEYGVLVWNFSNQSEGAKDETITLKLKFPPGMGMVNMRHYVVDADHSTFTAGWDKQYLEAVETGPQNADGIITVTMKKDSLHGFFFSKAPLKAVANPPITVTVNQPVHFDGGASMGLPANYRWDFDAADGVDFPIPDDGPPSAAHGYGVNPIFAHGYAKPGKYTVTLQVAGDGYGKEVNTATTIVTVTPETAPPPAPTGLSANSEATNHVVYLQWDTPKVADFTHVSGYNLYRKEDAGAWQKITPAPLQATCYVDEGAAFGKSYSYHLTAVDASKNESKPSADVTAAVAKTLKKPKAPVGIKAVIPSGDLVQLSWDNASLADGARVTGYNVYRRVAGGGEYTKLTMKPTVYKLYYDDVQNPGMANKYEYAVTAVDALGNESLQSVSAHPVAQ